jgi:uncharacterized protein YndB with AHSA1/START domain
MIETVEPIRREVVVGIGQQKAFALFTADMTVWWPPAHHIGSAPIKEIVVEPHTGGRWFTRHQDGTETSTGFVETWEPPGRLVLTWQIGGDWHYHEDLVTTVEVRFEALGDERTRVSVEHHMDGFGADAETMRKTFDDPGAWTSTLAAYAKAAG